MLFKISYNNIEDEVQSINIAKTLAKTLRWQNYCHNKRTDRPIKPIEIPEPLLEATGQ